MEALSIATVIPVDDLVGAVRQWGNLLGRKPTFVDGDRWAQFDLPAGRLCLAGADRSTDGVGALIKVDDLVTSRERVQALGWSASGVEAGPHEDRFVAVGPSGAPVTFYALRVQGSPV